MRYSIPFLCLLCAASAPAWGQSCSDYSWSSLPSVDGVGIPLFNGLPNGYCLETFDAGDGEKLYVGLYSGSPVQLATWDGTLVESIQTPLTSMFG